MSVQNGWKEYYKMFIVASYNDQLEYAADLRNDMWNCRREAALERKLESAESRAADLAESNREQAETIKTLRAEVAEQARRLEEARRMLDRAREASLDLGRILQFTRIGWDDTVTCQGVLEPINKIAFKIGEALGID